jgi:hypothetical protein
VRKKDKVGKSGRGAGKAPEPTGIDEYATFTSFMKRLVAVPHSEIKAKLDAEKRAKKRKSKQASASHVSA